MTVYHHQNTMATPTDWRSLCAELLEALENAIRVIYNEGGTKHTSTADAVIAKAAAALAQPEPEGLTYEELREWYSYCPEDGIELHSSKELAQKAAQEIMESYAKAAYSEGWHEDMESVSWGMILPVEQAQVVERTKADSDSGFDEWVQYALVPRRM